MKTKKTWHLIVPAVLICLMAGLIWQWNVVDRNFVSAAVDKDAGRDGSDNESENKQEGALKTVGVVRPRPAAGEALISFPGRARAGTQATLFFRVAAPLVRIHANPGDPVKKGDLLMELDDRDYRRQVGVVLSKLKSAKANLLKMETGARPEDVKIMKANLAAARADLDLARKQLERHEILYKTQSVTEQAYDRAKTSVQGLAARVTALEEQLARDTRGARKEDIMAARATIEELNVQLEIARDRLDDTRLMAPFDGVVTRTIPHAHEMVAAGAPVMMLDDISCVEIPVDVPETLVHRVLALKNAHGFEAFFLTAGDRRYPARLIEYSSRADQATGTYEFVFTVSPSPQDMIFPGMTAEIRVAADAEQSGSGGLVVPLQSLMGVAGNTAHVFRVDPQTKKAERRSVTFETLAGSHEVNVLSGLSRNDLVVDQGATFIRQGETVNFELPATQGAM